MLARSFRCDRPSLTSLLIVLSLSFPMIAADPAANSPDERAVRLSAESFELLNRLNAQTSGGITNPLVGPIAIFAGDAESLSRALKRSDAAAAQAAFDALRSDQSTIDNSARSHPDALNDADWKSLASELDQLAPEVAQMRPAPAKGSSIPATSARVEPKATTAEVASSSPPPLVSIQSREHEDGGVLRIKGYIQGTALKSAGVYEGARCVKSFKVNDVPGRQKVELDIGIADPPSDTTIRVVDADGRAASAPVTDPADEIAANNATPVDETNRESGPIALGGSRESGVDVFRNSTRNEAAEPTDDATVKEIPSRGPLTASPSKRHTLGGKLAGVAITVLAVTPVSGTPPTYEVMGQIQGAGVTRAGIYVDGRLVKTIPVQSGTDYVSFDERFILKGVQPTIRAYGVGDQYAENAIDLTNGLPADEELGPLASAGVPQQAGAPGIGVQISGVRALGPTLYAVSGTVSGNVASAGLYQNGVLAQPIAVGGLAGGLSGGIGSVLGSLIPGTTHSYSFNLRYNPGAGFASIRAYDHNGAYTEQPIMAGGMMNPYGAGTHGPSSFNPYAIGRPPGSSSRSSW